MSQESTTWGELRPPVEPFPAFDTYLELWDFCFSGYRDLLPERVRETFVAVSQRYTDEVVKYAAQSTATKGSWAIHVLGPDDLMRRSDELAALREANEINILMAKEREEVVKKGQDPWPYVIALVVKDERETDIQVDSDVIQ